MKKSELKRGDSQLKRTAFKQRKAKRTFPNFERLAQALFRDAAREQLVCAVCDKGGQFDAHHVVSKQKLKDMGLGIWDPRNSLRVHRDCHLTHENATMGRGRKDQRIKLSKLTPQNIEYANEILGEKATDYLERHYVH